MCKPSGLGFVHEIGVPAGGADRFAEMRVLTWARGFGGGEVRPDDRYTRDARDLRCTLSTGFYLPNLGLPYFFKGLLADVGADIVDSA